MDRCIITRDVEITVDPAFVEEEQVAKEIRFENRERKREEGFYNIWAMCKIFLDVGVAREVGHKFRFVGGVFVKAGINPFLYLLGHATRAELVPYFLWDSGH